MLSNRLSGDEKSIRHYTSTPHLDIYRSNSVSQYSNNRGDRDGGLKSPVVVGSTFGPNATLGSFQSTFSTFSHHKSGADMRYRDDPNPYKVSNIDEFRIKVQDPYKSSTRQLHNHHHHPHHNNSSHHHHHQSQQPPSHHQSQTTYAPYNDDEVDDGVPEGELPPDAAAAVFRRLSIKYDAPQYYQHSTNSGSSSGDGDYEIPDPDYDGDSTTGSSEDLPIPEPLVLADSPSHHHHHHINHHHHAGADSCGEEYSISISASDETASASHSSPSPTTITKISESERSKIEHALKGRKTSIYVADSLANLYYMSKSVVPPRPNSTGSTESGQSKGSNGQDWQLKYTGVPVILLDTGETKNRDKRQIQIVLAEAGTGLALWKDVVDNLTSYRVTNESISFHTMHLSTDHTIVVGLSFDDEDTAEKFAQRIDKLTSDFANISLSGSKSKNKKDKTKVKPVKYVKPKKTEISTPCGFMHVSSIKHGSQDPKLYTTLQNFVKNGGKSPTKSSEVSF